MVITDPTAIISINNEKTNETHSNHDIINLSNRYIKNSNDPNEQFKEFKVITSTILDEIKQMENEGKNMSRTSNIHQEVSTNYLNSNSLSTLA